jgi:hypothetical protein
MTLRIVAVFIFSVMLTGCFAAYEAKPPCPPPGAVQTIDNCHYVLKVTRMGPGTGEVTGQVPAAVVKDNQKNSDWWGFRGFLRFFSYDINNYPFFEYPFQLESPPDASKLMIGQPAEFHGKVGKSSLRFGAPPEPAKMSGGVMPCPAPGEPSTQRCYYRLTVTKIEPGTGLVTGTVAPSVVEENAKLFPTLAVQRYTFNEYTFQVRDLEKLNLKSNSDYDFVSVPSANDLEMCAKTECGDHF